MVLTVLAACTAAFWFSVLAAFTARYLLGRERAAVAFAVAAPVLAVTMVAVVSADLATGGHASPLHAVGALHLGLLVGYAPSALARAERHCTYLVAGGRPPGREEPNVAERAALLRSRWGHHVLAWVAGSLTLLGPVLALGDTARTAALTDATVVWAAVVLVEGLVAALHATRPRAGGRPRRLPAREAAAARS